jgi:hypothetical protein
MNPDIATLGFTRVQDFQLAWNLGPSLTIDGVVGPKTTAAAKISAERHRRGQSDLSAHFSAAEFACRCGGKLDGCRKLLVHRELLRGLEKLRTRAATSISIVSGYRCPRRNAAVDGASGSQHLYGTAADIGGPLKLQAVRGLAVFSGIGRKVESGRVTHVDVRDVSGHNTTHGSTERPTLWTYPGS